MLLQQQINHTPEGILRVSLVSSIRISQSNNVCIVFFLLRNVSNVHQVEKKEHISEK